MHDWVHDEIRAWHPARAFLGLGGGGSQTPHPLAGCGPGAEAVLLDLLRDEDDESVRLFLVSALRGSGARDDPAVEALMEAVRDPFESVRQEAAYGLGERGPAAVGAVPGLVEALADQDGGVRAASAWALRKIDAAAADRAGCP
jgi:HEAT repeat protein